VDYRNKVFPFYIVTFYLMKSATA